MDGNRKRKRGNQKAIGMKSNVSGDKKRRLRVASDTSDDEWVPGSGINSHQTSKRSRRQKGIFIQPINSLLCTWNNQVHGIRTLQFKLYYLCRMI
jgi:hypothetical protein